MALLCLLFYSELIFFVKPGRKAVPLLEMAMAVAFPMPLLAPVIIKERPAMDTSRSFSTNLLEADRKPFLKDIRTL